MTGDGSDPLGDHMARCTDPECQVCNEEVTDEEFAEAMSRIAETLKEALKVVERISSKLKERANKPT
jgi:hypothetical protein